MADKSWATSQGVANIVIRLVVMLVWISAGTCGLTADGVASQRSELNEPAASAGSISRPSPVLAQREAGNWLKSQLNDALSHGSPRFIVPGGTYRISPDSPDLPHVVLKDVSNFQLLGRSATILCETKNTALYLDHCSNVKISGITVDYDPLPMTQGTITKVTMTGHEASLDFQVHKGYDEPNYDGKGVGHIWIVDAVMRQLKPGCSNYGSPKEMLKLGDGRFRLVYNFPRHDAVAPGDLIKLPQRLNLRAPHAVFLSRCTAVAFENVSILSAPCFGFVSTYGDGISLNNVRVVPGPTPPGASEPRIFSSSADAINLSNNTTGPVIRNSVAASNGDDGIAIYNQPAFVFGKKNDSTLTVGLNWGGSANYHPGDLLRFFLFARGKTEERKVVSSIPASLPANFEDIKEQHLKAPRRGSLAICIELALDAPLDAEPGDVLQNTRYAGQAFEISGNRLIDNASRGINANQSGGVVRNNYVKHSYLSGLQVTAFVKDGGSGSAFQHSVKIIDNDICDTCIGFSKEKNWQGAISIANWDSKHPFPDGHRDIVITGNSIDKPNGIGIKVQCASNVVISGNRFGGPGIRSSGAAIFLDVVNHVKVVSNVLIGSGWGLPGAELIAGSNCHDIQAEAPVRLFPDSGGLGPKR